MRRTIPCVLLLDELAHLPHEVADNVDHLSQPRYRRTAERLPPLDGMVVLEHQVERRYLRFCRR